MYPTTYRINWTFKWNIFPGERHPSVSRFISDGNQMHSIVSSTLSVAQESLPITLYNWTNKNCLIFSIPQMEQAIWLLYIHCIKPGRSGALDTNSKKQTAFPSQNWMVLSGRVDCPVEVFAFGSWNYLTELELYCRIYYRQIFFA